MDSKKMEFPNPKQFTGRARRLLYEWMELDRYLSVSDEIDYEVSCQNVFGLPIEYTVTYHVKSICSVENIDDLNLPEVKNPPIFASEFKMEVILPEDYPCVDAMPEFRFLTMDRNGKPIPHPWHPNIRYFGEFAGRVCLNATDTYSSLAWSIGRIAKYLKYEIYHAYQEPPYPEDPRVAKWVLSQGEPNDWVVF